MSFIRIALITGITVFIFGCADESNVFLRVTDPNRYWHLTGFEVQPPKGNDWFKLPDVLVAPNSIVFKKEEYFRFMLDTRYPEVTTVIVRASGIVFKGSFHNRFDSASASDDLVEIIKKHPEQLGLNHIEVAPERFKEFDCARFSGTLKNNLIETSVGYIQFEAQKGLLCLHPRYNNFGVLMTVVNGARQGTQKVNRDPEAWALFESLRFTPISSSRRKSMNIKELPRTTVPKRKKALVNLQQKGIFFMAEGA